MHAMVTTPGTPALDLLPPHRHHWPPVCLWTPALWQPRQHPQQCLALGRLLSRGGVGILDYIINSLPLIWPTFRFYSNRQKYVEGYRSFAGFCFLANIAKLPMRRNKQNITTIFLTYISAQSQSSSNCYSQKQTFSHKKITVRISRLLR